MKALAEYDRAYAAEQLRRARHPLRRRIKRLPEETDMLKVAVVGLGGIGNIHAKVYKDITFRSTRVERTGERTARVTGDLTLHGQTHPVTLNATLSMDVTE